MESNGFCHDEEVLERFHFEYEFDAKYLGAKDGAEPLATLIAKDYQRASKI